MDQTRAASNLNNEPAWIINRTALLIIYGDLHNRGNFVGVFWFQDVNCFRYFTEYATSSLDIRKDMYDCKLDSELLEMNNLIGKSNYFAAHYCETASSPERLSKNFITAAVLLSSLCRMASQLLV